MTAEALLSTFRAGKQTEAICRFLLCLQLAAVMPIPDQNSPLMVVIDF